MGTHLFWFTAAVLFSTVSTEYRCVCSHNPSKDVLAHPANSAVVIGHLTDSDCRKLADNSSVTRNYHVIEFHHRLGYVAAENDLEVKTCQGDPPVTDIITAHIVWPNGTYGLMQAATGCPGGNVTWADGYRKYDTEDSGSNNHFSANIQHYIAGSFASNDLMTRFCIKTTAAVDSYDRDWPAGTYCLLKKGDCPSGFGTGYIYWDDEDNGNGNTAGGALPDGSYNSDTKIYYCCRQDGNASHPILLPRDIPFVLVRYGASCQAVYGMTVSAVFIQWDDEDGGNRDSSGGAHPFDDGGSEDHRLHFCHYQASQTGTAPGIIG